MLMKMMTFLTLSNGSGDDSIGDDKLMIMMLMMMMTILN